MRVLEEYNQSVLVRLTPNEFKGLKSMAEAFVQGGDDE